jgi:hypothetical protein
MDKTLFNEKLKPIGYLKRKWGGSIEGDQWEELVLKLFPKDIKCPPCTEVEFIWKNRKWSRKCVICGEKTVVKNIITK